MRVLVSALALLVASAGPGRAEVTVRLNAGRVDITANAAPLSEVLDRLARQTGMKVVYDGPAPRQLVTVSLMGRVPAEAVHDLLEGQGVNYALLGDTAGTGVQTLLMTGTTAPVASSASSFNAAAATRSRSASPPLSSPDAVDEPEEDPDDEPAPEAPGAPGAPNGTMDAAGTGAKARPLIPPGTTGATPPAAAPMQMAPSMPRTPPANTNPGFVPVSPLSPLGPFAPALPGGAPVGGLPGGTPVGGPGAPNEPPEPSEPPLD